MSVLGMFVNVSRLNWIVVILSGLVVYRNLPYMFAALYLINFFFFFFPCNDQI